ncbi:MAG: glycosyltransferase [Candidatus Margulisiibacteriota bacterium]
MKLALVHDFLSQFGGAERVVAVLHELYPDAPLYTSIYAPDRLPEPFRRMDIRTTFMQRLPFVHQLFKLYFMIYPLAFEGIDLAAYEVILSSSSAFAKGVRKQPGQLHVCYCYTPMRFGWRYDDYVRNEPFPGFIKQLLPFFLEPIKQWDRRNSASVDHFIAISRVVADRIKQIYGRESAIIYPPVETDFFQPAGIERDHFLLVSRLNAYKRVELAVAACKELDLPLKIVGDGPDKGRLQRLAGRNTEFLGRLSDFEVAKLMAECRALIFPGEEDFGITPVEAMSCGRPVIAYRAGGALETVIEDETGLFFDEPTPAALVSTLQRFKFKLFDKSRVRAHALKFDKRHFSRQLAAFVKEKYEEKFGR